MAPWCDNGPKFNLKSLTSFVETALCDSDRICIVNEERQEVFLIIALVDLNEFPLIFQKVQHAHFRKKIPSNFLRINLKGKLMFNKM